MNLENVYGEYLADLLANAPAPSKRTCFYLARYGKLESGVNHYSVWAEKRTTRLDDKPSNNELHDSGEVKGRVRKFNHRLVDLEQEDAEESDDSLLNLPQEDEEQLDYYLSDSEQEDEEHSDYLSDLKQGKQPDYGTSDLGQEDDEQSDHDAQGLSQDDKVQSGYNPLGSGEEGEEQLDYDALGSGQEDEEQLDCNPSGLGQEEAKKDERCSTSVETSTKQLSNSDRCYRCHVEKRACDNSTPKKANIAHPARRAEEDATV